MSLELASEGRQPPGLLSPCIQGESEQYAQTIQHTYNVGLLSPCTQGESEGVPWSRPVAATPLDPPFARGEAVRDRGLTPPALLSRTENQGFAFRG